RYGKAGVPAHYDLHCRKPTLEGPDNPPQHAQRPAGRMGITGTMHRGHQLATLAVKDQQWVIHVLIVIAVEEGQLLLAMGGIVGSVNVQDEDFRRLREGSITHC